MTSRPVPGAADTEAALLAVSGVRIELQRRSGSLPVVEQVSFEVRDKEAVGLVGESGSGKTVTSLSLLGLLPSVMRVTDGSVRFAGRELLGLAAGELRAIRGRDIGMVFQDPIGSLNPAFTIGDQITETLLAHGGVSKRQARERAVELLELVGITAPKQRLDAYPHQFSIGMAQRALIAMAIACGPKLVIADEPVTALDVTVRAQILDLLRSLRERLGMSLILISHDLGVIAHSVERVAVMYAGQVVEQASVDDLFYSPRHPYTQALLESRTDTSTRGQPLRSIPGTVPRIGEMPPGCRFAPRCAYAEAACSAAPVAFESLPRGGGVRCIRHADLALRGVRPTSTEVARPAQTRATGDATPLLELRGLRMSFPLRGGILRRVSGHVRAVDGVTLALRQGQTLGLVGESGSGKSSVARLVLRLMDPTGGEMRFDGQDLGGLRGGKLRTVRRDVQMVFQNPYASLDPLLPVGESVAEPLEVHLRLTAPERRKRVTELLERVGLDALYAQRFPRELSGGQCQRAAIARALALHPRLIVCDEPMSALDVSTQAQVINLLMELQRDLGLAYLLISHDLSVVHHMSDSIAVMYLGRIVEMGPAEQVYAEPRHPYTQLLLSGVLQADPRARQERPPTITAEAADPTIAAFGCRFRNRCPQAMEVCRTEDPRDHPVADGWVACHLFDPVAMGARIERRR